MDNETRTAIDYRQQANHLRICVLLPTYNNAATLATVIAEVFHYCNDLIVVNDGSTDDTAAILQQFPQIKLLQHHPNQGKGVALRKGLAHAAELGFRYAISIDSDGQHFAKDLPVFYQKIQQQPDSLLIGARNMDQATVPGKSSFGNRFSNFWFWVDTGIKGPDTQSGYRLYPVQLLKNIRFVTRKFEFEIEVIVRAAWKGIRVDWVPVTVYYPPPGERVSHFRPFKDFTRISILNTVLFLVAILYIKPRDFIRGIFNKKKRTAFVHKYLLGTGEKPSVKALSLGFGVFMGIVPIWGFQLLVGIPLAVFFRLNKAMFILAANISIPPMIPLILFLSHWVGGFWMGENRIRLHYSQEISLKTLGQGFTQYVWGALTLALIAGALVTAISYLLFKFSKRKMPLSA